ncbi:MAG: hypothetical protein HUJ26_04560 [Planctomycetaceae bacterium]|nr:hypothetical protein [Planctomycetaceae bacterium]
MKSKQNSSIPPRYYYRSVRNGDQVRRHYVGPLSDPHVALLYRKKRLVQATQEAYEEAADEEATLASGIEAQIEQYRRQAKPLLESWREHRGYRECHDGIWRLRQRQRRKPVMKYPDLRLLIKQAEAGDDEALRQLQLLMDGNGSLWQPFGDLSQVVIRQLLDVTVGNNVMAREGLKRQMEEMREELNGESVSPIRRMAVEQVLITWLDVHYQVLLASQPGLSKTARNCLEGRVQRARKRHREALMTVAQIEQVEGGGD